MSHNPNSVKLSVSNDVTKNVNSTSMRSLDTEDRPTRYVAHSSRQRHLLSIVISTKKSIPFPLRRNPANQITMLASSSRILLRTAAGIGGRVAARALAARVASSSFPTSQEVRKNNHNALNDMQVIVSHSFALTASSLEDSRVSPRRTTSPVHVYQSQG